MARMIPGSMLAVIEQAGHMSPMERPADVSAALGAWLGAVERAVDDRRR
jgi:pimeloyl-ACP methyl ester carboxylesterase